MTTGKIDALETASTAAPAAAAADAPPSSAAVFTRAYETTSKALGSAPNRRGEGLALQQMSYSQVYRPAGGTAAGEWAGCRAGYKRRSVPTISGENR